MKRTNKEGDEKIKIVYHDLEGKIAIETVWASKDGDFYRIKNIPFFAPNLAYDDLVSVEKDGGDLYFDSLIDHSGHTTLQILIYMENDFKYITDELVKFGCSWEGSHLKGYISVDVSPNIDYSPIKKYLIDKAREKKMDYKEACLSHKTS